MHEHALMVGLMRKVEEVAQAHRALRVKTVRVTVGALTHFTAEHFREHFEEAARGTIAEGSRLDVRVLTDPSDARAQDIFLEQVELETDDEEAR